MTGHSKILPIPIDLRVKSFVRRRKQNFAAIPIGLRAKYFAEQSFLRVSFIELAQNFIAIHCDVTMALNV